MESQLTRPSDHHLEEEEHQEKGTTKVLKKVKEKAKKIKNTLTKHGHHHEHDQREQHIPDDHDLDEEDDDDDDEIITDPEVHGAPIYESAAVRCGVTGQPESLIHPGKAHTPAPEEMVPPGTKVFPVVSSGQTEPVEQVRDTSHDLGGLAHPTRVFDLSDREESREAHLTPHNTPVSMVSGTEDAARTFVPADEDPLGQRKVNLERPKGLEEDPAAPGGGLGSSGVVSNYQSKVTDPSGRGGQEVEVAPIIESLGKMKVTDAPHDTSRSGLEREFPTRGEQLNLKSGHEVEKDFPTKSHELHVKSGNDLGKEFSTGSHDQFSPELTPPKPLENPATGEAPELKTRAMADDEDMPKQSSFTEKIISATSVIADKAASAKNAVASKLGSSGEGGGIGIRGEEETPRSAMEYGKKMANTVTEKLTPVYEKMKGTGTSVMSKMPLSSGGETKEEQDRGVSARDYLAEKLKPGEEDKALSEIISKKLHLGGEKKKGTVTESVEVEKRLGGFSDERSEKETKYGESIVDGNEGGVVEKLRIAVTSWLGGTTEDVKNKSADSVQESSQSIGSTIGTQLGLAGTTGGDVGDTGGGGTGGRKLQESGN